jgi:hypothetical protein
LSASRVSGPGWAQRRWREIKSFHQEYLLVHWNPKSRCAAAITALVLAAATGARADDINFNVSGYGTLGGTFTSDANYQFIHDSSEFRGATNQFDVGLESRLGIQAVVDFQNSLSVVVQELVRRRGDQDFSPGTEWAYIQYKPTSAWKLRLGRVVMSTFLMSESREVGYAQPWFRAPNELYGIEPFNNMDGGQVAWHADLDNLGVDLQGAYGKTSQNLLVGGSSTAINAKYTYNLSASATYGSVLVRVADTMVATPFTLPLGGTTVNFLNKDKFLTAGAQYDDGKALLIGEWSKRSEPSAPIVGLPLARSTSWYAAGGWHFDKLTPMVMYGKYSVGDSLLYTPQDLSTWSAVLRYDLITNFALKAQYSRPQVANSAYFAIPNPASSERVNVYSVGVDFVF